MPIYTEPEAPEFARLEARHGWFPAVLLHEYGEQAGAPADTETPAALNWTEQVPITRRYDFDEAECSLAYTASSNGYRCTVWDVTGEEDDPWAVFLVDDFGARLLPEYSVFDEDLSDSEREAILSRSANELPERLERGEFDRTGTPLTIPEWLKEAREGE